MIKYNINDRYTYYSMEVNMANQEVSVLLVRYITEINEKINRFESSEEYKALQARCDEIDK